MEKRLVCVGAALTPFLFGIAVNVLVQGRVSAWFSHVREQRSHSCQVKLVDDEHNVVWIPCERTDP